MNVTVLTKIKTVEAVEFAWKPNSRIPVKPDVAATELRKVYEQHRAVTPDAVVDAAKDEDSPLHPVFQWDDTEAAREYREQQARHLMRSLVVTYRRQDGELTPPIRAFVKLVSSADDPALDMDTEDATQPRVYLPVRQIMGEDDHRRRYVRQALQELGTWRRRYRDISEFAKLFEAIDQLEEESKRA